MKPTDKIIGVIPSRMGATRLPGKPLRTLAGVPMLQRVYEGAAGCGKLAQVIVATESPEIESFCRERSIPVRMTSAAHNSGTDRVWQVVEELGAEAAVNIQGDEPMVRSAMLDTLVEALFADPAVEVATLCTPCPEDEVALPSVCKLVAAANGRALYFSRAAIPYPREGRPAYRKHLGYYAYSRRALAQFHGWAPSPLEETERLEQLRFLYHGVPIMVAETPFNTIGIDTAEDLAVAETHFRAGR